MANPTAKSAPSLTHYQLLEVPASATSAEIKQSFRRLAKIYHPDRHTNSTQQTQFLKKFQVISAAYEVLSDDHQRRLYDQNLRYGPTANQATRADRTEAAQQQYRKARQQEPKREETLEEWLKRVYTPINKILSTIIKPIRAQIKALSADPFDDELMDDFNTYIEESQEALEKAQNLLKKMPNPPIAASVSANLYYCVSQLGDALNELELFTQNYNETYLHDGVEMFRIAEGLRKEALAAALELKH
jgi:molecular chaperone DnaJ